MSNNFNLWVEKLKDNSDIVSTISRYVTLIKKGKTWWGNCPFHFEKTPSFAINEVEQYYHCFGCGVSGDVIKFIEKYESLEFIEACEVLAKNANMEMPEFEGSKNIFKDKRNKDVIYKILRDAAMYYFNNLKSGKYAVANNYIQKRRLDSATVTNFAIGYSIGWNEVVAYLKGLNYSVEDIKLSGVVDERNNELYDAYAKRLIFPIINANNDVVGFSARLLEDADFAKYKNTAQTIVFDKSKAVYSINNIKKLKQSGDLKEIILVEGQMDVIALYKNGIKNAVATMGTSLTAMHAKELKRYSEKVVVCFDGDSAGIKATLRSVEILNDAKIEVYVASLPDGLDPDDYVNKYGKSEFLKHINDALYWTEFLIYDFAKKYDLNKPNERTDFIINSLNVIKKLDSHSEQNIYLEIVKKLTNVSIDVLRRDFLNLENAKTTVGRDVEKGNESLQLTNENAYVKAVKFIVASLLHKKAYAKTDIDISEYILNTDYKKILEYIEESYRNGKTPSVSTMFTMFDVENSKDIYDVVNYNFNEEFDNINYFKDCVKAVVVSGLKMQQSKLIEQSRAVQTNDEKKEIAEKINKITLKIKNFKI